MTQEEKSLLLKDPCARLPYGVRVHIKGEYRKSHKVEEIDIADNLIRYFENMHLCEERIEDCNPYLRPMSSMTEEERSNLWAYCRTQEGIIYDVGVSGAINSPAIIDFLNAHYFDYSGLIDKGLALEAPEDMYDYDRKTD